MIFPLMTTALLAPPCPDSQEVRVEVYTDEGQVVDCPDALPWALSQFELNFDALMEQATDGLCCDQHSAIERLRSLSIVDPTLFAQLRQAYEYELKADDVGLMQLPAVVFHTPERPFVFYTQDFDLALRSFKRLYP